MTRRKRRLWMLGAAAAVVAILGWAGVRALLRHEPGFYRDALAIPAETLDAAGIEFEKTLLAVHNDLRRGAGWEANWSQTQVNGWLASDLPEKFPRLLPAEIQNPRVRFETGRASVAFRYQQDKWDLVVSAQLHARLTDVPNQMAVRVESLRAGALPVPTGDWLQRISTAFRRQGILIRWTEERGRPVALVTVSPPVPESRDHEALIEQLEMTDQWLRLAGHRRERD